MRVKYTSIVIDHLFFPEEITLFETSRVGHYSLLARFSNIKLFNDYTAVMLF